MTQSTAEPVVAPLVDGPARPRLHGLDLARGIAIIAVIVYHFCWDLEEFGIQYFGLFEAPFWLAARTVIAGAFLVLAGVGLVLATHAGLNWRRYGWRLAKIVAAAAVVSAVTYWNFPNAGVFFGILHAIALGSVLGLAFVRAPWWVAAAAGVVVVGLDYFPQAWLSADWLLWLGMGDAPVRAVDYVPVVPWFSGILFGIAAGKLLRATRSWPGLASWRADGPVGASVRFLGRHTLMIYLVHQPILFGLFYAWFFLSAQ